MYIVNAKLMNTESDVKAQEDDIPQGFGDEAPQPVYSYPLNCIYIKIYMH